MKQRTSASSNQSNYAKIQTMQQRHSKNSSQPSYIIVSAIKSSNKQLNKETVKILVSPVTKFHTKGYNFYTQKQPRTINSWVAVKVNLIEKRFDIQFFTDKLGPVWIYIDFLKCKDLILSVLWTPTGKFSNRSTTSSTFKSCFSPSKVIDVCGALFK